MAALLVQGLGVFHFFPLRIREGGRVETLRISVVVLVATIAPVGLFRSRADRNAMELKQLGVWPRRILLAVTLFLISILCGTT